MHKRLFGRNDLTQVLFIICHLTNLCERKNVETKEKEGAFTLN